MSELLSLKVLTKPLSIRAVDVVACMGGGSYSCCAGGGESEGSVNAGNKELSPEEALSEHSWSSSDATTARDAGTDNQDEDQELFLQAYTSFWNQSRSFHNTPVRVMWSPNIEHLPDSWPLARMYLPIDGLFFQAEKVAIAAAMEVIASQPHPEGCQPAMTHLLPRSIPV